MSGPDRSKALQRAFEKAMDTDNEALMAGVRPEELDKAPSKEFRRRMKALFEKEKKQRMSAVWRRALITAAAIAAAFGIMALLGVFNKDPGGIQDVQNNTPVPVSAAPLTDAPPSEPPSDLPSDLPTGPLPPETEGPTAALPSDTPAWTAFVPATGTPGPTNRPTPTPTEPPTGTPLPVTEPPGTPTPPPVTPTPPPETPTPPPPIEPTDLPDPPGTDVPPQPTSEPFLPTDPPGTDVPPEPTEEPTEPTEEPTSEPSIEPTTPSPYHPGDIITLGRYEQDNSLSNGAEDIEWIVLSVTNGRMLVISRYALDAAPYNDTYEDTTWSLSTIRNGFLRDFMNEAFTAEERGRIILHYVQTPANPVYGTPGGNSVFDRLFLLSIDEASSLMSTRYCEATAYAHARGVNTYGNRCNWWLRSPGGLASAAAFVDHRGRIDNEGAAVMTGYFGVRPAMWVSIP